MPPRASSENPWARIDAWLGRHAPAVRDALRPAASREDLARLDRALGARVHPSITEAYRAHDGAIGEVSTVFGAVRAPREAAWVRYMGWGTIERALSRLAMMRSIDPDWPATWLTLGEDAGGNLLVVDAASGAVMAWDHETNEAAEVATDLRAWMAQLAADMASGRVVWLDDDERLELLDAPPAKPGPAPDVGPERIGRTFLEVLSEHSLIAIAPDADVRELVISLARALATRDEARRRERVIAVLESSPAVDEVFGDDDHLGAVIDEFG